MNKEEWIDGYEPLYEKERNEGIQKVLATLTPREQQALKYRYYEGMKYREIGSNLKIGGARASQIVHTALRRLRVPVRLKMLAEYEPRAEIWIKRWERDDLIREKEAVETQIQQELKQKKQREKAHQKYLQKVEKRKQEYEEYQKNAARILEERKARQQKELKQTREYYDSFHKSQSIPPPDVILVKKKNGQYALGAPRNWQDDIGLIDTSSDPETYERWLKYLLRKEHNKERTPWK